MSRHLRLALFLCLGLLVCGAQAASPQATAKQKELDNLRKRITNLQRDLEKTSESQNEAADALRESERAISDSNRRLADLNRQRGAATQSLQQLQTQGAELKLDIQEQQNLLGRLLYQQYLNGSDEYLKLLLNNRDPNQVAREIQYHGYIARDRAAWLQSLRDKLDRLQQITEQTQHKSDEIASLQTEARTQQQSLEKDKRTRQQVLNKISTQLKKQRSEISRLQRDENNLSQLVDKLSKMLAEPKRGGGDGGIDNDKLPDDRFDGKPFAQLKGKLILPVKGKVTNRYGTQRPDSTVSWKGLFLRAPANAQVKAVAAGRVVFADWLRGFGNLLIIDHGKGYMSLYGNNETLYKQVGEVLHGGDVVAAVGNTGGNAESGLYFEIRYNGQTQDPMKWVAR